MNARPFTQVDVFTRTPFFGNPLAVVLDGVGLDDVAMQRFARWTNLSETTFLLPPTVPGRAQGADYRVRIFTPGGELPFAGHPTLGSCHAWLQAGGRPQSPGHIVQECAAGLIRLRQFGERLAFAAPPLRRSPVDPALLAQVVDALGLETGRILASQWLDNGPVWLGLLIDSAERLLSLKPQHQTLKDLGVKVGLAHIEKGLDAPVLISRSSAEARAFGARAPRPGDGEQALPTLTVRAFAAAIGVDEDPVTGSLNASLAQWLMAEGRLPARYQAVQGACLGRHGELFLSQDDAGQVWVAGDVVSCVSGQVQI